MDNFTLAVVIGMVAIIGVLILQVAMDKGAPEPTGTTKPRGKKSR